MNYFINKLDAYFCVSKKGSTIRREILGGISAYLAMAYIIFVNPMVLGNAGMNKEAVFAATLIGAAIATLIMGVYAKFPLALASCMSMNAFFTYSVVLQSGFSWEEALSCVLLSSIIFIILSISKVRFKILEAIPDTLKNAGSVGLGLFIAFIGLKNGGVIVADENLLISLGTIKNPNFIIAITGIIVLAIMLVIKNKNSIIVAMFSSLAVGLFIGYLDKVGYINLSAEYAETLPYLSGNLLVSPITPLKTMFNETFLVAIYNIPKVLTVSGISVILTFTFLDFFGTAATLNAATSEMRNLDIPDEANKKIYLADALGTFFGALFGTSNITTYIESVSGIVSGARTGLMAVVVAILFLVSFIFYPFLSLFTSAVTAPALVAVGVFMFRNVSTVDWKEGFECVIPAFFTIIVMPLTGSIALGLCVGFVLYVVLMLFAKRRKEIHVYMYYIAIISAVYIASSVIVK